MLSLYTFQKVPLGFSSKCPCVALVLLTLPFSLHTILFIPMQVGSLYWVLYIYLFLVTYNAGVCILRGIA